MEQQQPYQTPTAQQQAAWLSAQRAQQQAAAATPGMAAPGTQPAHNTGYHAALAGSTRQAAPAYTGIGSSASTGHWGGANFAQSPHDILTAGASAPSQLSTQGPYYSQAQQQPQYQYMQPYQQVQASYQDPLRQQQQQQHYSMPPQYVQQQQQQVRRQQQQQQQQPQHQQGQQHVQQQVQPQRHQQPPQAQAQQGPQQTLQQQAAQQQQQPQQQPLQQPHTQQMFYPGFTTTSTRSIPPQLSAAGGGSTSGAIAPQTRAAGPAAPDAGVTALLLLQRQASSSSSARQTPQQQPMQQHQQQPYQQLPQQQSQPQPQQRPTTYKSPLAPSPSHPHATHAQQSHLQHPPLYYQAPQPSIASAAAAATLLVELDPPPGVDAQQVMSRAAQRMQEKEARTASAHPFVPKPLGAHRATSGASPLDAVGNTAKMSTSQPMEAPQSKQHGHGGQFLGDAQAAALLSLDQQHRQHMAPIPQPVFTPPWPPAARYTPPTSVNMKPVTPVGVPVKPPMHDTSTAQQQQQQQQQQQPSIPAAVAHASALPPQVQPPSHLQQQQQQQVLLQPPAPIAAAVAGSTAVNAPLLAPPPSVTSSTPAPASPFVSASSYTSASGDTHTAATSQLHTQPSDASAAIPDLQPPKLDQGESDESSRSSDGEPEPMDEAEGGSVNDVKAEMTHASMEAADDVSRAETSKEADELQQLRLPTYEPISAHRSRKRRRRSTSTDGALTMASVCEALVPVRVDLDIGGVRIVESMMVDATDDTVTPKQIAAQFCTDTELPKEIEVQVTKQIKAQLVAFRASRALYVPDAKGSGYLCPITVSVRHGSLVYNDQLEWDVLSPHNSPEAFARLTVADLGLPPEFEPVIASSIWEQVLNHREILSRGSAPAVLAHEKLVRRRQEEGKTVEVWSLPHKIREPVRLKDEAVLWGPKLVQPSLKAQIEYTVDALRLARPSQAQ